MANAIPVSGQRDVSKPAQVKTKKVTDGNSGNEVVTFPKGTQPEQLKSHDATIKRN